MSTDGESIDSEKSVARTLAYVSLPVLITWLLLPLTFLLPTIDSTRAPYFDLTGTPAEIAYWIAWSGSKIGAPIIALVAIVAFVSSRIISQGDRFKEALLIAAITVLFAGGGSALNENFLKAELQVSRPNVQLLAGVDGTGPLGMTAEEFYEKPDESTRRDAMMRALSSESLPVALSPLVESHWIDETGYSFPSGHAFAAMMFASFFLALATNFLSGKRIVFFYTLLPWALLVCYSRPILRVHTPMDITIGGLQGVVAGLLAWLLFRLLAQRA